MSSESQVKNIMEHIDEGLKELDDLEEKLERYDKLLQVTTALALGCIAVLSFTNKVVCYSN